MDVKILGGLVQWEIEAIYSAKQTHPFTLGAWQWQLRMERLLIPRETYLELLPWQHSAANCRASFTIKLLSFPPNEKPVIVPLPGYSDASLENGVSWLWPHCIFGTIVIEIKFLEMKRLADFFGGPPITVYPSCQLTLPGFMARYTLARMLEEGIFTDITVKAGGGDGIRAHRAVLAARSPVFMRMFSHDLREKELSTVDIPDMSLEACKAFIAFLYDGGGLSQDDLLAHRCELLAAGDKYDVEELKAMCQASLITDADADNLLERLQMAHLYRLRDLKLTCFTLLFEFRKIKEIQEDFDAFVKDADEDLVAEIKKFQEDFDKSGKLELKVDDEQITAWDRRWVEGYFSLPGLYTPWYCSHPDMNFTL